MEEPKAISQLMLGYQTNCLGPLCGNAVGAASITQFVCRTIADMPQAIAEISEDGAWAEVVS